MDVASIIAIGVGIVNLIALGFVGWQTFLTRKSVQLSESNLWESQRASVISSLPRAYSIIYVQNCLEGWKKDLQLLIDGEKKLKEMIRSNKCDIKFNSQHWHGQSKGLINKVSYDHLPEWLKETLIIGAQYYFEGICLIDMVCATKETQVSRLDLMEGMISRATQGVNRITEILVFIDQLVPKWYLESPASLQESDFWDKE